MMEYQKSQGTEKEWDKLKGEKGVVLGFKYPTVFHGVRSFNKKTKGISFGFRT